MELALGRVPALADAGVKQFINGPESFTPDGNFILGEAPELRNYFVAAGFNSAGIANAGGAGHLIAQWIVDGEAPVDLWDVDIRRFAGFHANRRHLADRTVETLGLHYAMRWPREELVTVRPLRRSPLYDRLQAEGAVFGTKLNWERANYFLPPGTAASSPTLEIPGWLSLVLEEQRACREDVVVFDQTSFAKFVLKGRDALAVLQRLCANEMDVPAGRMVYTAMLNARGGFESDLTVTRLGPIEFFIVTGSGQCTRDFAWIERNIQPGEHAVLFDITGAWSVVSVMGPKAEALLARLSPDDLSKAGMPFSTVHAIDVGYTRVRAARMSYVGGPGYELYVPVEQCVTLYDALHTEGPAFGLRDAGYYTIDALRIEAGRRAWGAELSPDETPWQAGLGFAVKLTKPDGFIGREALVSSRDAPLAKRLLAFAFDDPQAFPWGGEPILVDGAPVGELSSAGYSRLAGRAMALGYARMEQTITNECLAASRCEVDIAGERFAVTARVA
jgi:4-methylaminobutanoate oxidase (formaldehyde-forming)